MNKNRKKPKKESDHEELLARNGFYAELYNSQFEEAS